MHDHDSYYMLSAISYPYTDEVTSFSRLESNPTLNKLANELREYASKDPLSPLSNHIHSILDQPRDLLALEYFDNNTVNEPVFSSQLPDGFANLQEYKRAGIYHFVGQDGEDYVGSSSNLQTRLNEQHRVRGLNSNQTYRHPNFYDKVVNYGWEHFNLHILAIIDLPSTSFAQSYPDAFSLDVAEPLLRLDKYVITLVEQSYLDTLKPTLNSAPYANASFPNLGATGVVRDEVFKQMVSLAHQGRAFTEATLDLHRLNMTGKQLSLETRAKMSATKLGKTTVQITDHDTNEITAFTTKSAAAAHLGISIRTLGRWAIDPTAIRVTKSNSRVSVSIISI